MTPIDRFRRFLLFRRGSDCWYWCGAQNHFGHGYFTVGGRQGYAHRFAYEHYVGSIPVGRTIDHLCRNPSCVNPDHLEVVSNWENTLRGDNHVAANARKTHCERGHAFTPENTHRKGPRRVCRTCGREWMRQYRASR